MVPDIKHGFYWEIYLHVCVSVYVLVGYVCVMTKTNTVCIVESQTDKRKKKKPEIIADKKVKPTQ